MAGMDGLRSGKTGTLTLNKTTATRGSLLLLQYKLWLSGAQFCVSKLIIDFYKKIKCSSYMYLFAINTKLLTVRFSI